MSWEDIIKYDESYEIVDSAILKETAKKVQLLRNSMVGSENQTMSAKDVDMYLKSIKESILRVQKRLRHPHYQSEND